LREGLYFKDEEIRMIDIKEDESRIDRLRKIESRKLKLGR
jgi:hypothetical protein